MAEKKRMDQLVFERYGLEPGDDAYADKVLILSKNPNAGLQEGTKQNRGKSQMLRDGTGQGNQKAKKQKLRPKDFKQEGGKATMEDYMIQAAEEDKILQQKQAIEPKKNKLEEAIEDEKKRRKKFSGPVSGWFS